MISQQYIGALIVVVTTILSLLNIKYDTESLNQIIIAVVTLGSGIWIMIQRYKQGDINIAGLKIE